MAGERAAFNRDPGFVSTVIVRWKGKLMRVNVADYRPEIHGEIIEGPSVPPLPRVEPETAIKDPHLDAQGNRIADAASPAIHV